MMTLMLLLFLVVVVDEKIFFVIVDFRPVFTTVVLDQPCGEEDEGYREKGEDTHEEEPSCDLFVIFGDWM